MSSESNLKARNVWKLATFIVFNVAVFWMVLSTGVFDVRSLAELLSGLDIEAGLVGLGLPIVVIVLNGILSSNQKARLVFWRMQHPLPACRAFTELAQRDPRIDLATLSRRYGELPVEPTDQNRLWYRILKKNENRVSVEGAHQNFLLTRDMAGLSFLFIVVLGSSAVLAGSGVSEIGYLLLLLLQYLGLRHVAANTGYGFVRNVLAEESVTPTNTNASMYVFGYGSLMWDRWETAFDCRGRQLATLAEFKRDFNKASTRNWGSVATPGPTLGLKPQDAGECRGMAFEFPDSEGVRLLAELRRREGASFRLEEKEVTLASGQGVKAIVPMNDVSAATYLGDKTLEERVGMVRAAHGKDGSCAEYVANIRNRLRELGIQDEAVERFAALVEGA